MEFQPNPWVNNRRLQSVARVFLIFVSMALAATAFAQSRAREGFLAVQKQVENIKPGLIKSTVALRRPNGSGSGVIVSPDGYVLTAAHVIAGGRSKAIMVILADGRRLEGTILGANRDDDYGLVKINEPENLSVAPLGDSSMLRRGQWVLATGHPLGPKYQRPPVLRIGRVLYLRRDEDTRETDSIMSDAPIISGDSGGPLFDLNGRVVGINSMILQGDRRMSSIHVPVNLPKAVMAVLQKGENPTTADVNSAPLVKAIEDAQYALRAHDAEGATRAAAHGVAVDPTSARAKLLLARAYALKGKSAQALAAIEQACDLGFNDPEYLKREDDLSSLVDHPGMKRVLERLGTVGAIPGSRKGDQLVLAAAGNVEPNVDRGVVRLMSGTTEVALGTVMSSDGDVLTKASELPEGPVTCVMPDGSKAQVERKAVDGTWDIALLKVKSNNLPVLPLVDNGTVGLWTFSPDAAGGVSGIGMVSVAELPVMDKGIAGKPTSKAYLGVRLNELPKELLNQLGLSHGVVVEVEPGFPAAKAGLKTGDVIVEADGKAVTDPESFMDFMVNKKPGDSLRVKAVREDEKLSLEISLSNRPANVPGRGGLLVQLSGDVSRMQGPFPKVLQHDTVMKPTQMGGPLLDIEGHCIGLNIARADRTSTYAIAAKDLKEIYAKMKQKP